MKNSKLVLVLKSDRDSKNVSVGPLCNPWQIQLYEKNVESSHHQKPGIFNTISDPLPLCRIFLVTKWLAQVR